ncbi:hypothetical protein NDU88_004923 [Pleurodeles waltl]|uniref:Uncharacterized protein n=1 Tax=Pleurodeles waltl TaxID=8319 RepID=A0AAV7N2U8_PLEWA|nr:hypothetical protein NDU88_004923 [Pleurodeles waltl]
MLVDPGPGPEGSHRARLRAGGAAFAAPDALSHCAAGLCPLHTRTGGAEAPRLNEPKRDFRTSPPRCAALEPARGAGAPFWASRQRSHADRLQSKQRKDTSAQNQEHSAASP